MPERCLLCRARRWWAALQSTWLVGGAAEHVASSSSVTPCEKPLQNSVVLQSTPLQITVGPADDDGPQIDLTLDFDDMPLVKTIGLDYQEKFQVSVTSVSQTAIWWVSAHGWGAEDT